MFIMKLLRHYSAKNNHSYYIVKKYDVLQFGDRKTLDDPTLILYYVASEDVFSVIKLAHIAIGHGVVIVC